MLRYLRYATLVIGVVFVALGVLGFIPGLLWLPETAPPLAIGLGYGYLARFFGVNILLNLVHVGIGAWGIFAYTRGVDASRWFARVVAIAYGALAILGAIPATKMLFGLMPLLGHNIWLHGITAIVAAYFGFGAPKSREAQPSERAMTS